MPFDTNHAISRARLSPSVASDRPGPFLFHSLYRDVFKRMFDIALVLISFGLVLPIIGIMAALVALDGHTPFYTQLRVGRNGRVFRMIKIRTMVHDAEQLLQDRLDRDPALRAEWAATQKLKHDFRITRIGLILRKTSLDELPQLFNVLTGSMSLVGPRPMMPSQETLYPGQAYYRMRPGITGFWQISDRNNCDFRDRAGFDADYEASMSLATDLRVLCRTVSVVMRGTGY